MKEYLVVYERAGDNYSAYAPDLPGCVACGDTPEETKALMREAMALYITALEEDGAPIPEATTSAGMVPVSA